MHMVLLPTKRLTQVRGRMVHFFNCILPLVVYGALCCVVHRGQTNNRIVKCLLGSQIFGELFYLFEYMCGLMKP